MSKNVRFFLAFDLLLEDFFDSVDVSIGVPDGLAEPVANGLESKLTDFPPTGDAEACVVGTNSSVGPGLLKLFAAKAAASKRSRLNSLWESLSIAR